MKAVLRGKFIALSASIKKLERAYTSSLTTHLKALVKKKLERTYTSSLTAHLKALEQKEANSPKRRRWQEIIKLRAEINQVETKRTIYKESRKSGAGSLRKSTR